MRKVGTSVPEVSKILIVDDETLNVDMLSRRLVRAGYGVETALNGKQALEIAAREAIDLVLLDQMMPGMSGLEVLRELRSRPVTSQLPVIMVTALVDGNNVAEALDMGANDYVTKPLDFQIAQARIRAQLARRQVYSDLHKKEQRLELALQGSGKMVLDWDRVKDTIYYSPEWYRMLGYESDEGANLHEDRLSRVHPNDLPMLMGALKALEKAPLDSLERKGDSLIRENNPVEFRIRHRDGTYRWISLQGISIHTDDGKLVRVVGGATEITEKKTRDPLTGLPNELALSSEIENAIQKRQQGLSPAFAVVLFDVDRFKLIEESLGVAGSEECLKHVASKAQTALIKCAAPKGLNGAINSKLARLNKDEFGFIIDPCNDYDEATNAAESLLHAMHSGFLLAEREMICAIKLGIAIYQPDYNDASSLIRDARTAVYAAKTQGIPSWKIFNSSMRVRHEDRLQMEIDLRLALEREEFEVFYQSRVSLSTGRICGFEALIRWNHPTRGLIPPAEFIPVAEVNGLIHEIGLWVLRCACRQLQVWRDKYALPPDFEISVNLSANQCREPHLVREVADILLQTGLPPANLNLELTESILLENLKEAKSVLTALKELGVGLKMDDFGTGFSSLKYLCELPFDCLKIDRSFTSELDKNNLDSDEMIRTILQMARNLSMETVAEGIETARHLIRLKEMGCEFGQGYFFSRPIRAADAEVMLQANLQEYDNSVDSSTWTR